MSDAYKELEASPPHCPRCAKLERELRECREVLVRWHKLMFPDPKRKKRKK